MSDNENFTIKTPVAKKVKVNGVYQVHNDDLKILTSHGYKHDVIVTSINKKRKTARVKTITSLERRKNNKWFFTSGKLDDVRSGKILLIPINQFKTKHLSGINHNSKVVPLEKIHYKEINDKTKFPNRYKFLIHKK
ncbi:MAG: hypothetical protein ACI311_06795 [Bacilli bacterium]